MSLLNGRVVTFGIVGLLHRTPKARRPTMPNGRRSHSARAQRATPPNAAAVPAEGWREAAPEPEPERALLSSALLQPRRLPQRLRPVGPLPTELRLASPEVPI